MTRKERQAAAAKRRTERNQRWTQILMDNPDNWIKALEKALLEETELPQTREEVMGDFAAFVRKTNQKIRDARALEAECRAAHNANPPPEKPENLFQIGTQI